MRSSYRHTSIPSTTELKSRSVDDIYGDTTFLDDASSAFTALEVVNPSTAAFFDGKHTETRNLLKACVRSSDSHQPEEIGRRSTWVQMENPCYPELAAALRLPFRTSLVDLQSPSAHVIGLHVQGAFLRDEWIRFSPHCNMLIAVKGSGKTCVRMLALRTGRRRACQQEQDGR